MNEPIWVPKAAVIVIHDRQIARHGGRSGTRDAALLESALSRAPHEYDYQDADLFTCASAYAFGIVRAHAFLDGNKRTGFVTALTFLRLNGQDFSTDPISGARMMEDLAAGGVGEDAFGQWLRDGASPV